MSGNGLDGGVARQIARVAVSPVRPLVVCDADEVIVDFMAGFEPYLERAGLYFSWDSYRLDGNIRRRGDDAAVAGTDIRALIEAFFAEATEALPPIDGAAPALAALARRAQIVILSNIPRPSRAGRRRWLDRHGLGYPLVANVGAKGPAVRALAARTEAPAYFIDDSPAHHRSVARDAAHVFRLHFVGDARLGALLEPAPDSHRRAWDWAEARAAIEDDLGRRGF